ncbi:hypothetical protein HDU67_007794, partial [Dinochytrium kinnereticum]
MKKSAPVPLADFGCLDGRRLASGSYGFGSTVTLGIQFGRLDTRYQASSPFYLRRGGGKIDNVVPHVIPAAAAPVESQYELVADVVHDGMSGRVGLLDRLRSQQVVVGGSAQDSCLIVPAEAVLSGQE